MGEIIVAAFGAKTAMNTGLDIGFESGAGLTF